MTLTLLQADNLLDVLAKAAIALPPDGTDFQVLTRGRLRACYADLAELYAASGYDVKDAGADVLRKIRSKRTTTTKNERTK